MNGEGHGRIRGVRLANAFDDLTFDIFTDKGGSGSPADQGCGDLGVSDNVRPIPAGKPIQFIAESTEILDQ